MCPEVDGCADKTGLPRAKEEAILALVRPSKAESIRIKSNASI
jgi:hypothetical protein